jgi:hypothetical protein
MCLLVVLQVRYFITRPRSEKVFASIETSYSTVVLEKDRYTHCASRQSAICDAAVSEAMEEERSLIAQVIQRNEVDVIRRLESERQQCDITTSDIVTRARTYFAAGEQVPQLPQSEACSAEDREYALELIRDPASKLRTRLVHVNDEYKVRECQSMFTSGRLGPG